MLPNDILPKPNLYKNKLPLLSGDGDLCSNPSVDQILQEVENIESILAISALKYEFDEKQEEQNLFK